jgi:hypothetical protein
MPNLLAMQRRFKVNLKRWGGSGFLVRAGIKRACWIGRAEYTPRERGLYIDGAERFYIAAYGLAIAPDFELDEIEFKSKRYKINLPPTGPRPDGLVIYYDCNVLYVGAAT